MQLPIYPLITRLKDAASHRQNWYSDGSACGARLAQIMSWFELLFQLGPSYGYFAEPVKSVLVVKEKHLEEANRLFSNLGVEVFLASRFLGGYVGKEEGVHEHVPLKVELWVKAVGPLASAACAYPQSAYAAFPRSLSCEWTYLQRVVGGCDD